jgi:hypothetical protein
MRALMSFLRRLWFFGADTDRAVSAERKKQLDRHGHLRRGRDWPG